ncbi:hypothetical protein MTP99_009388 [Tenebrio molitor]|nr:hypothetical protein MTP99_009388 [Tenebrio molitor]
MTVTCHFLKEKKLVSTVLDTLQLAGTHNAENISTCLQDIIKTWKLDGKVLAVVTDNASNMLLACKIIKLEHLPCFAHTLNLTVEDGIKKTENLEELLKKCRDIVSYFKRSTKASDCLREEQRQRNEATLKVIQDVSTRWNSTFLMIERILKLVWPNASAALVLSVSPLFYMGFQSLNFVDILWPYTQGRSKGGGQVGPAHPRILLAHPRKKCFSCESVYPSDPSAQCSLVYPSTPRSAQCTQVPPEVLSVPKYPQKCSVAPKCPQ